MNKETIHKIILIKLTICMVLTMIQCKKKNTQEQASPAIDTCSGKSPVSANFKVMQALDFGKLVEDDTIACYPSITDTANKTKRCESCVLVANETNASFYQWQVGSNTSNSKKFELSFTQAYGLVKAKLSVDKMPNRGCFPNDDGKDIVEKVFVVKEYDQHPLIGKYIGSFEDTPNDTLEVEIKPYIYECFRQWVQRGRPASDSGYPKGVDNSCGNVQSGEFPKLSIWGLIRNNWLEIPLYTSHTFQLDDISYTYGYEDVCFLGKKNFGRLKNGILTIELEYCNPCNTDCGLKYNSQGVAEYNPNSWKTRRAIFRKIQ